MMMGGKATGLGRRIPATGHDGTCQLSRQALITFWVEFAFCQRVGEVEDVRPSANFRSLKCSLSEHPITMFDDALLLAPSEDVTIIHCPRTAWHSACNYFKDAGLMYG